MTQVEPSQSHKVRRRRMLRLAVVLTVAGLVLASLFALRAFVDRQPDRQALEAECAPLVVLAFRGSGGLNLTPEETRSDGASYRYGDSELETNGWEGFVLRGLFAELADTTIEGFSADQIPVIGVGPSSSDDSPGYDALDPVVAAGPEGSAFTFSGSRILHSATRGAEAATLLIHERLEEAHGCPITPEFVTVGFSQGAMAARHTAELNPESVTAVVTIGDPYERPAPAEVSEAPAAGMGVARWMASDEQANELDSHYDSFNVTSICHDADLICRFEPLSGAFRLATGMYGDHSNYYSDAYPDEAVAHATAIARLALERWEQAREAEAGGDSVTGTGSQEVALRSPSIAIAGTPTLFSALTPALTGSNATFEFDLDGDGVYETDSPDGIAWVTFPNDDTHTVGVRVSDAASGDSSETTLTVTPAPTDAAAISFSPGGRLMGAPPSPNAE